MTGLANARSSAPRVLVLGGNIKPWKASERLHEAPTMSGIEAWVYVFSGDYQYGPAATEREIANYDIIIGNTNLDALSSLRRLAETRPPSTKWVSLIEGSATDYIYPRQDITEVLNASDLVNVINRYSVDLFRAMTSVPVEHIGIPYPVEGIRKLATPSAQRKKEIFLCPFLTSRWSEVFVARRLGLSYYGNERRISRRLNTAHRTWKKYGSLDPEYLNNRARSLYNEPTLDIRREQPLADHMAANGQAFLWLNFDERYTWGRNVLDAAALEVPIIATRSTGHAEDFFPGLMLEHPFELEKAYQLAKRLIDDRDFYEATCRIPIERFEHLLPVTMKEQLLRSLY